MTWVLITLVSVLAWANGANDNCKGVATLVGYGATTPRRALVWAAVTTVIGSILSFWTAAGLIKAFGGGGLFAAGTALDNTFFVSVLVGAVSWVVLATVLGMPVSTTHAITGGLCGAGMMAFGMASVHWSILGQRFAMPLLLGPLLALGLVYLIAFPLGWMMARFANRCACIVEEHAVALTTRGTAVVIPSGPQLVVADETQCDGAVGVRAGAVASALHWTGAGLVGLARGWNDTPKIAALALGAMGAAGVTYPNATAFGVVIVAMTLGGLVAGRGVLKTLAKKVTSMPLPESVTASWVSAGLVGMASGFGLPVSTTHVSTGSILGIGLKHDPSNLRWRVVGQIASAWVITLPFAAVTSALAAWLLGAGKV